MTELRILEAVPLIAAEYNLRRDEVSPCIACALDGNHGGERHQAAFTIGAWLRDRGLAREATERILVRWARKIGYSPRRACDVLTNVYATKPNGQWKYHGPGLRKKPGTHYHAVLGAVCEEIGCPRYCLPFQHVYQGPLREKYDRFVKLGWPDYLRTKRHDAAADYYRALCTLEHDRGFAPGSPLFTSYKQLADLARRDHRHAGTNLDYLHQLGLLDEWVRGSGVKGERRASKVKRRVPIPPPPKRRSKAAIRTGGAPPPTEVGGERQPSIGGGPPPDIGGAAS